MSELAFGECAACFNALERPFWDTYCFACQEEDIERQREDEQMGYVPDEDWYIA